MSQHNVVKTWGCYGRPEARVIYLMSTAVILLQAYYPVDLATAEFIAVSPLWYELRQATFENVYQLQREIIEIDETPIEVYPLNQVWMIECAACRIAGDCGVDLSSAWYNRGCFVLNPPWTQFAT